MIAVKTGDNCDYHVPMELAMASKTIANLLEDMAPGATSGEVPPPDDVVPLPNVSGRDMELIVAYWKARDQPIDAFADALNTVEKWNLMRAADFLNVTPLLTDMTAYMAAQLKDKTVEEMREIMGVTNDFTPDEEAEIRKECAWALR